MSERPVLKLKLLSPLLGGRFPLPSYATSGAAALDLCACVEEPVVLPARGRALVPTGLAAELPGPGWAALVFARSGLAAKGGVCLANGVGLIDSDYRGEIRVALLNLNDEPYTVRPGDRIAQLALVETPLPELVFTDELSGTERGAGGFGSTGISYRGERNVGKGTE